MNYLMRKKRALLFGLAVVLLASGCSSPPGPRTKTAAGAGALIGAGAGALVGNPFAGFIAGGAIGAATGHERERQANSTPPWNDAFYDTSPSADGNHIDDFATREPPNYPDNQPGDPFTTGAVSAMPQDYPPPSDHAASGSISQAYPQPDSSPYYVSPDTFYR